MEPRIQYAKAEDGVSIAYWTLGEGQPLVYMPLALWASHVGLEWQIPEFRDWYQRLARKRMVVRFDWRGTGLSDRNASCASVEARRMDLEALANAVGAPRFSIFAPNRSGPYALSLAARMLDRVSHLILWCTSARGADIFFQDQGRRAAFVALRQSDWDLYTRTVALANFGWSKAEFGREMTRLIRESVTSEILGDEESVLEALDTTDLLPDLQLPVLVVNRSDYPLFRVGVARELSARIPGARLVLLEGRWGMPMFGDSESVAQAVEEFLDEDQQEMVALAEGDVHTIVFTDVEGSTSLTDRLGDAKARDLLRTHERIVRDALRSHGGSEVKTMGDGFMASFSSATKALECAIAMQRAFEEHNESADEPIRVRVGLNAGEPIAEEEDLFGTAVIVAARIAAKAEGGEIIASDVVRQLVAGKGFLFADRGDTALRGFEDPVKLWEVKWQEDE